MTAKLQNCRHNSKQIVLVESPNHFARLSNQLFSLRRELQTIQRRMDACTDISQIGFQPLVHSIPIHNSLKKINAALVQLDRALPESIEVF